ncbi:MAG: hypothetical protein ACOX56_05935 [Acholeplasmataceae bacterium]
MKGRDIMCFCMKKRNDYKVYYHGTKSKNIEGIIFNQKLIQGEKNLQQSEDGIIYIVDDEHFYDAIYYSKDKYAYTFVRIEVFINSSLYENFKIVEKEVDFLGILAKYKHIEYKGEIDFSDESIKSAKIVSFKSGTKEYNNFFCLYTSNEFDKAKAMVDNASGYDLKVDLSKI